MTQVSVRSRLLLFAGAALVILYLSVTPNPPVPHTGILSWDKLQHALAYAFLMVLGGWAFLPLTSSQVYAWRYALTIVVVYGALMEVMQALLACGRSGDPIDVLANAVGGLAMYIPIRLLFCRRSHRTEEQRKS